MLPRNYDRWLGTWLGNVPEEKLATCDSCAMSAPPATPKDKLHEYFGANKCCTYFPSLPNFQVGSVLRDAAELAEGAKRVAARIGGRVGVDPLQLRAPRRRAELYRIGAHAGFGKADAYRCPYYGATGGCTIWAHREAVCSTYYCKYNAPIQGREFWTELKGLMNVLEMTVAVSCAMQLGIAGTTIDQLLNTDTTMRSAADVDEVADDDAHAKLWGTWAGREEAYYQECARLAQELDLAAITRLGGQSFERRLASVKKLFDAMVSPDVPDRLKIAPQLAVQAAGPGKVRLLAGANQPVEMRAMIVELLTYFQGQPLADVKVALNEQGYDVDASFLEKLYKCGFLVKAD